MAGTRAAIVLLGDSFLRKKGYNAFSYADISKELGIKNAAIHYHFPAKSDLINAIINYHKEQFQLFCQKSEKLLPFQKVEAFLDIYVQIEAEHKICLVGTLATDWDSIEKNIQENLKDFARQILLWLTSTLETGKITGVLNYQEEPKAKAMLIVTNMLAATQLSRITGSQGFQVIRNSILNSLKN